MKTKKSTSDVEGKALNEFRLCSLPIVTDRKLDDNIDPNRASLIRYVEKKWINHTALHYYFLDNPTIWRGNDTQKQAVRDAIQEWKDLGIGLEFQEVENAEDAEIRIGFEPGGSWSYVGRDCIDLVPDPRQRTTNYGWDLTTTHGRDTAMHELGHVLGFPHEHQNPNAGIVWNEDAVYDYFRGYPNYWGRDKTFHNVIRKISSEEVAGSGWDKDSIMHYSFNAGLIINPAEYQSNPLIPANGLSDVDINEVLKFYPDNDDSNELELVPYLSHHVTIDPGNQLDFIIKPTRTRNYTIQTFGPLDTVIVLFESVNGAQVYMAGDDDSGYNYSSKITTRLYKDKTYYLRLRLYFSGDSGNGAVMLW